MIFADTSAFLTYEDRDDPRNALAVAAWRDVFQRKEKVVVTNYIVVETVSVLQRRFGMQAVCTFLKEMLPAIAVHWVPPAVHDAAIEMMILAGRSNLSLVDLISFQMMRQLEIDTAIAFDKHFCEQGFRCIPG